MAETTDSRNHGGNNGWCKSWRKQRPKPHGLRVPVGDAEGVDRLERLAHVQPQLRGGRGRRSALSAGHN